MNHSAESFPEAGQPTIDLSRNHFESSSNGRLQGNPQDHAAPYPTTRMSGPPNCQAIPARSFPVKEALSQRTLASIHSTQGEGGGAP